MSVLAGREADVLESYLSGESVRSLALRHSVGQHTIRRLLDRNGIPRRRTQPVGRLLAEPPVTQVDSRVRALAGRPTELAYLAGLIDGEGCLLIYRKKDRRGTAHIRCTLTISNTSRRVIDWLQERLGGSANCSTDRRPGHLKVMHWRCEGPRVAQLLEVVQPYLVIKPELAALLIEMQRTLSYGATGQRLPDEIRAQREVIFARYQAERQDMRGR